MQATITYPDELLGIMAEINRYETRQNKFCNPKRKRLIIMINFYGNHFRNYFNGNINESTLIYKN